MICEDVKWYQRKFFSNRASCFFKYYVITTFYYIIIFNSEAIIKFKFLYINKKKTVKINLDDYKLVGT